MDEKQIVEKEIEKNDKPESISDIRITCSQRCSNWFRILSFMMINGKGSSNRNMLIGSGQLGLLLRLVDLIMGLVQ